MDPFNWLCPFCEHAVTVSANRVSAKGNILTVPNAEGFHALMTRFIVCPNQKCQKYSLYAALVDTAGWPDGSRYVPDGARTIEQWRLVPWGLSRTLPDFVPQAIRDDYREACSIVELSPKSAATLARRAVQGIIRGFWGIAKNTLYLELSELQTLIGSSVTQETWDSIDAVRTIGNIGAHMEKDINLIVEVDGDEAQLLITLVDTLIEDTYIARNQRQEHRAKLLALKGRTQAERIKPPAT